MAEMLFDPEPDPDDHSEPKQIIDRSPSDDRLAALAGADHLNADEVLDEAGQCQRLVNLAQARQLKLAARWADLNGNLDPTQSAGLPGMERLIAFGGDGTPTVAEFAPAELAAQLSLSPAAGGHLVADALDLRHRLPRLWSLVCAGDVRCGLARWVATETHDLSAEAAAKVDATVARYATKVGWGRLQAITTAAVIAADPAAARRRADAVRGSQGVWVSRDHDCGFKTLFARGAAPDLDALDHRLGQIADQLATFGDTDPLDLRRAKALGILANDPTITTEQLCFTDDKWTDKDEVGVAESTADTEADANQDTADAEPTTVAAAAPGGKAASGAGAPMKKRPSAGRAVLYLHLSEAGLCGRYGVARVEDLGPILIDQVRDFLQHRQVTVKPVIDLNRPMRAADCYETPTDIAEAVHLRSPADCFPNAATTSRRRGDLDHTIPYRPPDDGGPPGQTRLDNLGRLSRLQHRIKTHGRWKVKQLRSGVWVWTSPHAYHYLVDHTGTIPLGKL